ncbi:MAG TPA: ABC transporter substrate-binding protein [Anaerolineales bacterium]|nr:ABC transporter substrate-binding protein [Anaerolineales bacterium]
MSRNRLMLVLGLLVAVSMVLAACGPKDLSKIPGRVAGKGGYLDQIVFSVVSSDSAVTQLKAGAIDVYADGLAAADLPSIQQAGLKYAAYNGLYYDIMLNPAKFNNGVLNPFSDRKIREAMNWLVDRNYINQEIYAGGALAKWFAIGTQGPDYADLADTARALEAKYAYNLDKATQVVSDEMTSLGAAKDANGHWAVNGQAITLIFLIRPDSDGTRKPIGDYVAGQLEKVGFVVDREYKKSSEASPIWIGTDPADGKWNLYTAAWSSTVISRDDKGQFQQMYLNTSIQGIQPFLSNVADPAFQKVGDDLANANFTTLDQRRQMMIQAMTLSLQDSLQVWLIDGKNFAPYNNNVQVTSDLAAGIEGAQIWPMTLKFTDKDGGTLKWGEPDLFTEPWNPLGGSNWAWDQAAIRGTESGATMNDPFTGLVWPLFLDHATVIATTGLPIGKTLSWVDLKFQDKISVPSDAVVDWDAKAQKFITNGEKNPNGTTAKIESIAVYPSNLFNTVTWHDGSKLSAADFVMGMIMVFDRANKDSAIYDDAAVPNFQSFMSTFKGFRITSTSPLTIEWYSDAFVQDAELDVTTMWPGPVAGNSYAYGEGAWDVVALSNMAEADGKLAYSSDKAAAKSIEQTSYVGGPSLAILAADLDTMIANKTVPYAATLSKYITPAQAVERYTNLKNWYTAHGHFWIGTGPYYLDKAFLTEKTLTLSNYGRYTDPSSKWAQFGEPKLAAVAIDGPASVKIGDTATFNVAVTFKGAPYAASDIKMVKYLVYDATNTVVAVGEATFVSDGKYTVTLTADQTKTLAAGANKLEIAVVPLAVAVPTFADANFVTAP